MNINKINNKRLKITRQLKSKGFEIPFSYRDYTKNTIKFSMEIGKPTKHKEVKGIPWVNIQRFKPQLDTIIKKQFPQARLRFIRGDNWLARYEFIVKKPK
jgi:hypothetical protein